MVLLETPGEVDRGGPGRPVSTVRFSETVTVFCQLNSSTTHPHPSKGDGDLQRSVPDDPVPPSPPLRQGVETRRPRGVTTVPRRVSKGVRTRTVSESGALSSPIWTTYFSPKEKGGLPGPP